MKAMYHMKAMYQQMLVEARRIRPPINLDLEKYLILHIIKIKTSILPISKFKFKLITYNIKLILSQ